MILGKLVQAKNAAIVLSLIGFGNLCQLNADEFTLAANTEKMSNDNDKKSNMNCVFGEQCRFYPVHKDHYWFGAEALFWTVSESGFGCEFGDVTIKNRSVGGVTTTSVKERDKNIDFDWDWGFRVGTGYDFFCNGWDVEVDWTWFHDKGHRRSNDSHAHWWLHYNTVDAIFGRKFWVGSCVRLRPFTGLRYAGIRQHLRTHLETTFVTFAEDSLIKTRRKDIQKFWGVGPELGLQADCYFARGGSVYGSLTGAILFGHSKTKFKGNNSSTDIARLCSGGSSTGLSESVYDVDLGIRWEKRYMTVHAGLEYHHYSDFNQIGCCSDLNLYGVNFGLSRRY